jgi:hypothetical protein
MPQNVVEQFLLNDSLRIAARAAGRAALFPQLLPIPEPGRHRNRQRKSELMREHTYLPAMVGFMRHHIAKHFRTNRPGPSPAVPKKLINDKLIDAGLTLTTAERFGQHLRAASSALSQFHSGLLRRAVRAIELIWNLQVRSGKADPLAAHIVHVRENCPDSADVVRWLRLPRGWVQIFDKNLVHALISRKNPHCSAPELSLNSRSVKLRFVKFWLMNFDLAKLFSTNLCLARGHGSILLDLIILRRRRQAGIPRASIARKSFNRGERSPRFPQPSAATEKARTPLLCHYQPVAADSSIQNGRRERRTRQGCHRSVGLI